VVRKQKQLVRNVNRRNVLVLEQHRPFYGLGFNIDDVQLIEVTDSVKFAIFLLHLRNFML
jgi:hypothetical protein